MRTRTRRTCSKRRGGSVPLALVCGGMLLMGGCGSSPRAPRDDESSGVDPTVAQAAMLPTRLVIHPLTHMGVDSQGRPALVLHFELRDQFDQNTRALGVLEVGVQRPGLDPLLPGGGSGGGGEGSLGEVTWRVDLSRPETNALLFDDLVTRTYVITLTDLPDWLVAWSEQRPGVALGLGSPTVAARFRFADPTIRDGAAGRVVSDSARIGR